MELILVQGQFDGFARSLLAICARTPEFFSFCSRPNFLLYLNMTIMKPLTEFQKAIQAKIQSSKQFKDLNDALMKVDKFAVTPLPHHDVKSINDVLACLCMHFVSDTYSDNVKAHGPMWLKKNGGQGEACWNFNLKWTCEEINSSLGLPPDTPSLYEHLLVNNKLWWLEQSGSHGKELSTKLGPTSKEWKNIMELQKEMHLFYLGLFPNLQHSGVFLGEAAFKYFTIEVSRHSLNRPSVISSAASN